jgi:hypothetical protein
MVLPRFKGWTVDVRLRQFRKVLDDSHSLDSILFVEFDSQLGQELLADAGESLLRELT